MFLALNLILAKKQKVGECNSIEHKETKLVNIKNRTYYFYNDIINLDEFDGSKIKVDRKKFNDIDIHYLGMNIRIKLQNAMK